ncbi:imidazoleglycerol-phosphate dehydratase [Asticcacaulis sp. AC460]|uniref:imidazoleglycerol-phosphate dehydratase HisB n=1 Tax=Asticcacaulis sp. AC460 TaxID=1282360 RepID=UPI0003C3B33F|nr:imidazoleglycerol-phosphate dehydratase HisB [Asticcacaulis sp. AC460]ESQ87509.1 imidazoleglycerol-phosphate dehydratase [Asticcacaulis sp. AC460]
MFNSPFSSLGGAGLEAVPPSLEPLRERMAGFYGVEPHQLMVTRGASHGMEVVMRRLRVHGHEFVWAGQDHYIEDLCGVYSLAIRKPPEAGTLARGGGFYLIDNPSQKDGRAIDLVTARTLAVDIFPTLLVIDESYADASDGSLIDLATSEPNVVVLKSMSFLFGMSGARAGALIANTKTLQGLLKYCEPHPLPTPSVRAAESALSPSRALSVQARIDLIRGEQARLRERLKTSQLLEAFDLNEGPFLLLRPKNLIATQTALKRLGLSPQVTPTGLLLALGDVATNNRILKALDVADDAKPPRVGEVMRDTKETRISVLVNLDQPKPVKVETGIGFFDHMLDQVATHGGFSLQLACEGDLHIDGHHTVEDCMLAFGSALKQALGDRMGMARFGFVLPMDETEAKVSIDLGGRPFCVFKGDFQSTHIGDYQTEMTGHAFRSLSETLGASIHVEVDGGNDHHKTEACYKALGRALRQATRIEGDALPSTKGMLA